MVPRARYWLAGRFHSLLSVKGRGVVEAFSSSLPPAPLLMMVLWSMLTVRPGLVRPSAPYSRMMLFPLTADCWMTLLLIVALPPFGRSME